MDRPQERVVTKERAKAKARATPTTRAKARMAESQEKGKGKTKGPCFVGGKSGHRAVECWQCFQQARRDGGRGVGQLVADEVFGKHGAQFDSLQEWWESDNMVERSDLTMPDGDRMWTLVEPDMEMDYEDIFENVNFINLAKLKPQMDYEALFIICAPPFLWGTLSLVEGFCRKP